MECFLSKVIYVVNDMFSPTIELLKAAVDQDGQTDRQMTYFLSSRAIAKQSVNLCGNRRFSRFKVLEYGTGCAILDGNKS